MKKLLFLAYVALLATSCKTLQPSPLYEIRASAIDLGKYNTDSMFITTGDYFREYDPVGIVEAASFSGYVKGEKIQQKPTDAKPIIDDVYGSPSKTPEAFGYKYKNCKVYEAVEAAIEKAKTMGANAIVKIDITYTYYDARGARHSCIYVNGMAIRRK